MMKLASSLLASLAAFVSSFTLVQDGLTAVLRVGHVAK